MKSPRALIRTVGTALRGHRLVTTKGWLDVATWFPQNQPRKSPRARRRTVVGTSLQGLRLVMTKGWLAQWLDVATWFPQTQHVATSKPRAQLLRPRQPKRKVMMFYGRKHLQLRNEFLLHPNLDDPQPRLRLKTAF
uniref:Uncharacterized protein n=1 Tax=Brassica campestris TaxID=3711 RepID=A0A3P6A8U0_BRACM|nr:unnamed protein product [Brassica rapa]